MTPPAAHPPRPLLPDPAAALPPPEALARLMPMYLLLTPDARLRALGPTLRKLLHPGAGAQRPRPAPAPLPGPGGLGPDPDAGPIGQSLFTVFELHGPLPILDADALWARSGQMLKLRPRTGHDGLRLRGLVVPTEDGGGLMNLSFGIDTIRAVAALQLGAGDFAATDMALELLYLAEANAMVLAEMRAQGGRLDSARRQAEQEALTDPLTGLSNRRAADACLARLCAGRRGFALLHLDLDRFKAVNDSRGHAAGDAVLIQIAGILREHFRGSDCLARIGGDEFLAILPGMTSAALVTDLGRQLIQRIDRPISCPGGLCRVSASIGAVLVPPGGVRHAAALLQAADDALYAAKTAGRNRIELAPPMG